MAEEEKEAPKGSTTVESHESDGNTLPILIILIVVPFAIAVSALICFYTSLQAKHEDNGDVAVPIVQASIEDEGQISSVRDQQRADDIIVVVPRPNCTYADHITRTLTEILLQYKIGKSTCNLEEGGNVEEKSGETGIIKTRNATIKKGDPEQSRGSFLIYIVVALLLGLVVVAFLDVYKVKGKPSKSKPQLTKRCSLADLTVLRHSRRESMRRDSIADEHRVPLKLLGARPSLPDHRRCSFPIYPGDFTYGGHVSPRQGSRKASLDYYDEVYSYDYHHNRVVRLIRRF